MNPLNELKLHVESLATTVEHDPKFFASVVHYVRKLCEILSSGGPRLSVDEIGVLARKLEEFWAKYRPTGSGWYIPPSQTSTTDGIIHEISQLVAKLKQLSTEEWTALLPVGEVAQKMDDPNKHSTHAPCIFIGHGRSKLWARLQVHLKDELHLPVINYESESRVGESIVPVLEKMLAGATFAILVCTGEDDTAMGAVRARQNVIHEAGLFQGRLGFKKVVLLMQEGIEEFSNIAGLQHIPFSGERIEQTFYELGRTLKRENQIR